MYEDTKGSTQSTTRMPEQANMESLAILLAWLTQGSRSHTWPPCYTVPTPLFHKGRTHNRDSMQAVVLRVQLSHSLVQGLKFKRSLSKNSFMKLFGAECNHSTAIYSVYVACQCSAVYEYKSLKANRCCYGGQKNVNPSIPLLDIMKLRLSLFFEVNEIEMQKEQSHNKAIRQRLSRSDLNQSQGQATLSEMSGRSQDTAHRTWLQATI